MFPIITNKDDFIGKIQHKSEIGIIVKENYTIVQYNTMKPTTFDTAEMFECRGIVFDNLTGTVLRRPFEKFFNVNEKDTTQAHVLDQTKKIVQMTEKLDGTMIAPFMLNDEIFWGTKRCAEKFNDYIISSGITCGIESYVKSLLLDGKSPIFEWHDPSFESSVIVIKYNKPFFKLLAVRDNITGEYQNFRETAIANGVDVVQEYKCFGTVNEAVECVTKEEHNEGYVFVLDDGTRIKLKTFWYCARHRLIDFFSTPWMMKRLIVEYMLENVNSDTDWKSIIMWRKEFDGDGDDVIANMTDAQKIAFRMEILEVQNIVSLICANVMKCLNECKTKKEMGLCPDFVGKNVAFKAFYVRVNVRVELLLEMHKKWFNSNKNHNARIAKIMNENERK